MVVTGWLLRPNVMFANYIAICGESREEAEEILEKWRFCWERRGTKFSSLRQNMCVEKSGAKKIEGVEEVGEGEV